MEAPGPGRRGEFAVLLEDEPYEGQHVLERVFAGRMGGCGVCTWGVRCVWLGMWDGPINKRELLTFVKIIRLNVIGLSELLTFVKVIRLKCNTFVRVTDFCKNH